MGVRIVTVRKNHDCSSRDEDGFLCPRPIKKGEKAKTETEKWGRVSGNGSYYQTFYYHMNCPMPRRS